MSPNTANRSFWRLVTVAFAPYLVVATLCCGAVSLAAYLIGWEGSWGLVGWLLIGVVIAAVVVTLVAVARAALSLRRQLAATQAFEAQIARDRLDSAPRVIETAHRTRLTRVELVDDDRAYSLTYGLAAPRVVVSRGLVERTSANQLEAVFAHERYHVRNLDPLKVLVARVLRSGLFFLPALQNLHHRYLAGRELAADRAAYSACGKQALAGALYEVAASSEPATAGPAAAIGGSDFLEVRLAQLEAGREPPLPVIPRWSVVATGVGVIAMTVAVAVTAALIARSVAGTSLVGDGALRLVGPLACGGVWVLAVALVWRHLTRRR